LFLAVGLDEGRHASVDYFQLL